MPPTGGRTGARNSSVQAQLAGWSTADGTGVAFDSSTGFDLPNGAARSPDGAWIKRDRLTGLPEAEKDRFLPLCPDFLFELLSPSDSLEMTLRKMEEYLAAGARLAWLIDPGHRRVFVYRPSTPVEILDHPMSLSGEAVLPGFILDLTPIWDPGF